MNRRWAAFASLVVFLLALLVCKLQLGWSADDVGVAWTRLTQVDGLLSRGWWSDPHYNRFPLNTVAIFALHGDALRVPWRAHLVEWALLALVTLLIPVAISSLAKWDERTSINRVWGYCAAVLFASSCPLFLSVVDLSCTHYLLCFLFFLSALIVRHRPHGFILSAVLCGLGALCSEVGVFLAMQFVLLEFALRGGRAWRRDRIVWLCVSGAPYLISKIAILAIGGREALFWKGYGMRISDVPVNFARAVRYLLFPAQAAPLPLAAAVYLAVGVWLVVSRKPSQTPESKRRVAIFGTALCLSFLPFVFFAHESITPRLFSETYLIALLWAATVARTIGFVAKPLRAAAAFLALNQILFFSSSMMDAISAERTFRSFERQAASTPIADGSFAKGLAVVYLTRNQTPLQADWGLRLLLQHEGLRDLLLGWRALRPDQEVMIVYDDSSKICLPKSMSPATTDVISFTDGLDAPKRFSLCSSSCGECRDTPVLAALQVP